MTWGLFCKRLKRINIFTAGAIWLAFWGYGLSQSDLPPASVIPGLLLGTIALCVVVSAAYFIFVHAWLYVSGLSSDDGAQVKGGSITGLKIAAMSLPISVVGAMASSNANGGGALLADVVFMGAMFVCLGSIAYQFAFGATGFFSWQFKMEA